MCYTAYASAPSPIVADDLAGNRTARLAPGSRQAVGLVPTPLDDTRCCDRDRKRSHNQTPSRQGVPLDDHAQNLMTVGEVARRLGLPVYSLNYLLDRHPEIEPVQRVGAYRVFGQAGMEQMRVVIEKRLALKSEPLTAV